MSTSRRTKTILVAGATGRLGVVAETLLSRGHVVRAMTRDLQSEPAARLRGLGAEVVYGDFDDPASLELALAGCEALFATGTAHGAGLEGELRHGRNVARAAAAAGIPQLVYSSGDGAAPDSPLPLFAVKFAVEEQIRSLGIGHTILAPVYFMENLFNPWNLPPLREGVFPSPIPVEAPLPQLAIADLAAFVALVIERPAEFAGRRIALASDTVTGAEAAGALSLLTGRRLRAEQIQPQAPGLRALFQWLEQVGHDVDIAALRASHPEVRWHSYDDWARSQLARLRTVPLAPSPA